MTHDPPTHLVVVVMKIVLDPPPNSPHLGIAKEIVKFLLGPGGRKDPFCYQRLEKNTG